MALLLLALLAFAVVWGLWRRSKGAAARLLANAEAEAERIVARAEIDGQRIQKDMEILARERLLAARTEFERETRELRLELSAAESQLRDGEAELAVRLGSLEARRQLRLERGASAATVELVVDRPRLWWPNGMGPQDRYTVRITARTAGGATDERELKCGVRTIALDTEKLDASSRLFAFTVNGVRIFCKGGNWVTPDAIYGRITDAQYEHLVREARDAHFNMLRVNGCNAYEREAFFGRCETILRFTLDRNSRSRLYPSLESLYVDRDAKFVMPDNFVFEVKFFLRLPLRKATPTNTWRSS